MCQKSVQCMCLSPKRCEGVNECDYVRHMGVQK